MHKKVPLNKIRPNPFRDMERYPPPRDAVDRLKASIKSTGYWPNLVGREKDGYIQLAYGHSRLVALREVLGKRAQIAMTVEKLDNAKMARMMADENATQGGPTATAAMEAIRSLVQGYADGEINLPSVPARANKTDLRYAPLFALGYAGQNVPCISKPYTAMTLATFLGWTRAKDKGGGLKASEKVIDALAALAIGEEFDAEDDMTAISEGLGTEHVKEVVREVKRLKKDHVAAGASEEVATSRAINAGKKVADRVRHDGLGKRDIHEEAAKFAPKKPKPSQYPTADEVAAKIAKAVDGFMWFDRNDGFLKELIKHKAFIDPEQVKELQRVLRKLATRCQVLSDKLDANTVGSKLDLLEDQRN